MEVVIVDSLSSYLELISDLRLSLDDVVSKLKSNDQWWASYLERYPPRFFSDIGKASYVKSYYDFIDQESEDSKLIFLEEPEEENILIKFRSAMKQNLFEFKNSGSVCLFYLLFQ